MNHSSGTGLYERMMGWLAALGILAGVLSLVPLPPSVFGPAPVVPVLKLKKVPTLEMQAVPELETYADITMRPLFNPERKPYADSANYAAAAGPSGSSAGGDLSQYQLVGLVTAGDVQLAMIRKSGGRLLTVKPGDRLDGWSVGTIGPDGVTVSSSGGEKLLAIPKAANGAGTP
jgi:hypothetical protein